MTGADTLQEVRARTAEDEVDLGQLIGPLAKAGWPRRNTACVVRGRRIVVRQEVSMKAVLGEEADDVAETHALFNERRRRQFDDDGYILSER